MYYKQYVESVEQEGNEIVVFGLYQVGDVEERYEATTDTVTNAYAMLRQFRATFKKQLKGPTPEATV